MNEYLKNLKTALGREDELKESLKQLEAKHSKPGRYDFKDGNEGKPYKVLNVGERLKYHHRLDVANREHFLSAYRLIAQTTLDECANSLARYFDPEATKEKFDPHLKRYFAQAAEKYGDMLVRVVMGDLADNLPSQEDWIKLHGKEEINPSEDMEGFHGVELLIFLFHDESDPMDVYAIDILIEACRLERPDPNKDLIKRISLAEDRLTLEDADK